MNNVVQLSNAVEAALIQGDLSKLTPEQRLSYYKAVCDSVGLNPLTKPFDYITLNGKLTLYAKRDATDQLRKLSRVSITIPTRELIGDVYVVTARAKDKDGREDESTGAVNVKGLSGDNLANAYLKAETKAKRRVTLSICGLGLLDESETSSIPGVSEPSETPPAIEPPKSPAPPVVVEAEADVASLAEYVIPFGKYIGKKLAQIQRDDLKNYAHWLEDNATKTGKPLSDRAKEVVRAIRLLLAEAEDVPF